MGIFCFVPQCGNVSKGVKLHAVPYTKPIWKEWISICPFFKKYSVKQLEFIKICQKHFKPQHINENRRLTADAIPSLNLNLEPKYQNLDSSANIIDQEQPSSSFVVDHEVIIDLINSESISEDTQLEPQSPQAATSDIFSQSNQTIIIESQNNPCKQKIRPRNRILKSKLCRLSQKYNSIRTHFNSCKIKNIIMNYTFLKNFGKSLINLQSQLSGENPVNTTCEYSEAEKVFALSLYRLSPKGYRFLQKHLPLPDKSGIYSLLSEIDLRTGVNDFIFQHLTDVAMCKHTKDLQCVLLFNEVPIQNNVSFNFDSKVIEYFDSEEGSDRVLNKVFMFMLRGLFYPWKVPIALYYIPNSRTTHTLKSILKELIIATLNSGFVVRATVSKPESANITAINSLISETKKNIFNSGGNATNIIHYKVNENKIYHIYDVPHLLNCFYENFQKKNLLMEKRCAQWNYIEQLYAVDSQSVTRATKLTEKHMKPCDKIEVKYTSEVFSREVAVALLMQMKTYKVIEDTYNIRLPSVNTESGLFTAEMILFVSDLYNSLNGSGYASGSLHNSLSSNSKHFEFWDEALKKLQLIRFVKTNSIKTNSFFPSNTLLQHMFIHNIKTIRLLWSDVKIIPGVKFLNLTRLNLEPLEQYFSQICSHASSSSLISVFRTQLIDTFLKSKTLYTNCDNKTVLGTIHKLTKRRKVRFIFKL